jgi:activator of HSP90 ATPase
MILSGKTYQNNKGLIDTLLHNSMFNDGASVQWASAASIPQPDFSRLSQASNSYSYGGVTNIKNYSGEKSSSVNANPNTDVLLQNILLQLQRDEYKHAVIDQDNILSLRKAMKQFDRIEGRAKV